MANLLSRIVILYYSRGKIINADWLIEIYYLTKPTIVV